MSVGRVRNHPHPWQCPAGLQTEKTHSVMIEGIAAILFEVVDVADPIEVNGETTYEIRVVNQGSKAATNVQVLAELPAGIRPLSAEGPVRYSVSGNTVAFEALPRLAAKADTTYRIRAQGVQPGDQAVPACNCGPMRSRP